MLAGLWLGVGVLAAQSVAGLTLGEALALARLPEREAAQAEVRARAAEARVAGRWENPELSLEVEDFGGSDALRGTRGMETTLAVSQKVPVWQAGARYAAAAAAVAEAEAAVAWTLREQTHRVTLAFLDAWSAHAAVRLAEGVAERARQAETLATRRVEGGAAAPAEALAARTEARLAEAEARRAQAEARAADVALEALLQQAPATPPELPTALPAPLPGAETLLARLAQAPGAALAQAGVRRAQEAVRLAEAERWPEPTFSAGVRHRREDTETSFLVGISLPLPLYGAETARLEAAEAQLARVQAEARAADIERTVALKVALAQAEAARAEAETLRAQALPAAEEACALAEAAYRGGKTPMAALLEAQRTLAETQRRAAQAHAEVFKTQADVRRLTE